jgi:hypothetical protein
MGCKRHAAYSRVIKPRLPRGHFGEFAAGRQLRRRERVKPLFVRRRGDVALISRPRMSRLQAICRLGSKVYLLDGPLAAVLNLEPRVYSAQCKVLAGWR